MTHCYLHNLQVHIQIYILLQLHGTVKVTSCTILWQLPKWLQSNCRSEAQTNGTVLMFRKTQSCRMNNYRAAMAFYLLPLNAKVKQCTAKAREQSVISALLHCCIIDLIKCLIKLLFFRSCCLDSHTSPLCYKY